MKIYDFLSTELFGGVVPNVFEPIVEELSLRIAERFGSNRVSVQHEGNTGLFARAPSIIEFDDNQKLDIFTRVVLSKLDVIEVMIMPHYTKQHLPVSWSVEPGLILRRLVGRLKTGSDKNIRFVLNAEFYYYVVASVNRGNSNVMVVELNGVDVVKTRREDAISLEGEEVLYRDNVGYFEKRQFIKTLLAEELKDVTLDFICNNHCAILKNSRAKGVVVDRKGHELDVVSNFYGEIVKRREQIPFE